MRFVSCALLLACGSRTPLGVSEPGAPPGCPNDDATIATTMRITADDHYRLWVNGILIDDGVRKWWEVQTLAVTLHRSRRNTIAIEGTNMWTVDGTDRGVVADLQVGTHHLTTSAAWRLSTKLIAGWEMPAFDASKWANAISEGTNGMAPYGSVLGNSTAEWLWSYPSNVPAEKKTNDETIWLRRDFYVDASGNVRDDPTSCP